MIFLETNRLLFRSHQLSDEKTFIEMHTDAEVRRYVGGAPWPPEKALARFRNEYLGQPIETYGLWATILKPDGTYIGACGLNGSAGNSRVTLAFYIARPFWGQRFASEAAQAFIGMAFSRLHLPRIFADVDSRNEASKHILEKFGFQHISEEKISANGRIICTYELRNPSALPPSS